MNYDEIYLLDIFVNVLNNIIYINIYCYALYYSYMHYLHILMILYICVSMHVLPFYLVTPDDGSTKSKHVGEYRV